MKAIVLETEGREAAVLLRDGTVRIARGIYEVGQTFDYVAMPALRQWIAAAAVFLAMLGLGTGWLVDRNFVSCAEVSLDVNPSIVYTVNKRGAVLSVTAANSDAEAIVAALDDVRLVPLCDVVAETLSLLADEGYLDATETDYVLVNVSADDEERQEALVRQIEAAFTATMESDPDIEYRIDRSDRETAREAAAQGMSAGRYAAWQQEPGTIDREAYTTMPVQRIIEERENAPGAEDEPERIPTAEGKVPDEGLTSEDGGENPDDDQQTERPRDDQPTGEAPTVDEPQGEPPQGGEPRDEAPMGEMPRDEKARDEASPQDEPPQGGEPQDEAPMGEMSRDEKARDRGSPQGEPPPG